MELADRLRETADRLPGAPPGDPAATFRRGRRRRQRRHAGIAVAAAAGVIAIAVVGVPLLPSGGPGELEVADQPGVSEPAPDESEQAPGTTGQFGGLATIVGPPAAIVSSTAPFAWTVAISPGENSIWCVTTTRGSTFLGDATGEICDQLIGPDSDDPRVFGSGASAVMANPDGTPAEGLSWGLAPAAADEVTVLLTDGTRAAAELAEEVTGDGRLWAIGYLDTEVVAVEASADGTVLAGGIPSTAVPASGPVVTPQDAFGDRLEPAGLERFARDAPVFDLRADDELYALQLPVGGTLGIRVRDGFAPLMWATDCDLLDTEPLPDGWIGLCREFAHPDVGRTFGLFPHGTTSGITSDSELTQQFIEAFTACLADEGITVDRVDAIVTEDRELQMRGWASSGEPPPGSESADLDCENALMQELQLRPDLG